MKRSLYVSLLTIMYFSACQGSEELEQSQEKEYTVSIMARIGKTVSGARYLQDHENAIASFSKTDDIGVFMDNDSAVAGYSMELPGLQKRVSFGKIKTRNILFTHIIPTPVPKPKVRKI